MKTLIFNDFKLLYTYNNKKYKKNYFLIHKYFNEGIDKDSKITL